MNVFANNYSKTGYIIDTAFYFGMCAIGLLILGYKLPAPEWPRTFLIIVGALFAWTFIEYLVHRFLLHKIEPFKAAHDEHHEHPNRLIAQPTYISAAFFLFLLVIPSIFFTGFLNGLTISLGVIFGYSIFGWVHNILHQQIASNAWLKKRKLMHSIHHIDGQTNFGVTTGFWDIIFRTNKKGTHWLP